VGPLAKLGRELRTLWLFSRVQRRMGSVPSEGSTTVADVFESVVDAHAASVAVCCAGRELSYQELDAAANRVASWARSQGVGVGDCVALLMPNRAEYLEVWLGLAKLGAQIALVNTSLRAGPLAHAITVSGAGILVLDASLAEQYATARDELETPPVVWALGGDVTDAQNLDEALAAASPARPPADVRAGLRTADNLFFIYTSGTTGNPKAAYFSHHRFLQAGFAYTVLAGIVPSDRVYCVLPLYHTAGGVLAAGMALVNGAALVLREKFSASRFWDDCRSYDVTVFQYIGELCRYLLNLPPSPGDRDHHVRCAVGNGLRPDIWEAFQSRFAIRDIREFYGATEGNFAIVNIDNKVGAVGRVPPYLKNLFPVEVIRFDVETETHPRGADGFCIRCGPGEPGEAIGRIPGEKDNQPLGKFEGYRDRAESEKKILHDVFAKDDAWYRTGDLLSYDAEGYFYFVDRIGDTFRWKGENVATSQVAEVLSVYPSVREANVYGVRVPGADGRAGMAAIVADDDLDLARFYDHMRGQLAEYARPVFIRIRREMDTTGTFKHRKVDLVREGFDPARVSDPLYFRDEVRGALVPLDRTLYDRIVSGELRL
jgi:fatty-acyl-CoA synthase